MREKATRTAIIDLGTNTFNLLVIEQGGQTDEPGEKPFHIVCSEEMPVFLGRGGVEHGVITEDAFARGMAALRRHKATALSHGAEQVLGFGTSALRNARNGPELARQAMEELGIAIAIIPGEEEAGLILDGVRQAVQLGDRPALIMDIGGGSTEFILATGKALMWKRSFELGVTRLRERLPTSDPMTVDEESRIAQHLDSRLEALYAVIARHEPHQLIGSSGSFDTLAAMLAAQRGTVLGAGDTTLRFTALEFDALKDQLMQMPRNERLQVAGLPEHRVGTVCYALIQIERVLLAGGIRELAWSRYALKEGAAARLGA